MAQITLYHDRRLNEVSRMNETMKDPQTPEEWQYAANLAHAFLLIEAARLYGLIEGLEEEEVDVWRCEDIIRRAAEIGIAPTDELIRPLVDDLLHEVDHVR